MLVLDLVDCGFCLLICLHLCGGCLLLGLIARLTLRCLGGFGCTAVLFVFI